MSRIHEALKRAEQELKSSAPVPLPFEHHSAVEESVEDHRNFFVTTMEDGLGDVTATAPESSTPDQLLSAARKSLWNSDPKRLLFADPKAHNEPGMEQFRTLRSRLYQLREKKPLKAIMVSSALPGEGKTFVASNLAYVLARQQGRRVLLIDADVRKPSMHECIGTENIPGLNDYLQGNATEQEILQHGQYENLYFIAGGKAVSNPAELVANGRLKHLLQTVAPLFDWILIDSPPVVPITDGAMIGRLADGVLLVVKSETTPVDLVQRAKDELKGLPLLGAVLNWGEQLHSGYSSYYYTYGKTVR